jgi:hypothetical protein
MIGLHRHAARFTVLGLGLALSAGLMAGCNTKEEAAQLEAKISEALSTLSPEDRKMAEAQRFCAVQTEERLGSMGAPKKVTVNGQPVFICCGSCAKNAQANPAKTLRTVQELKAKAKAQSSS